MLGVTVLLCITSNISCGMSEGLTTEQPLHCVTSRRSDSVPWHLVPTSTHLAEQWSLGKQSRSQGAQRSLVLATKLLLHFLLRNTYRKHGPPLKNHTLYDTAHPRAEMPQKMTAGCLVALTFCIKVNGFPSLGSFRACRAPKG